MNKPGDSWFTVKQEAISSLKESGSKFIGLAFEAGNEDDVKEKLEELRKKYFDATHICYAYILGREKNDFKAHDAGEPRHTAGDPILSQIRSLDLTDTLVVVVRYFGGKKLGRSGLVQAYKLAAGSVLEKAGKAERIAVVDMKIKFSADRTGDIMRLLKFNREAILNSHFEDSNTVLLRVREQFANQFSKELHKIQGILFL
ncbi:MAG TPA: YigZ family protein [Cyclobacteriaceae bacterium]|nr:YigZ family protein [Cyclobacteriaceae bacterium]